MKVVKLVCGIVSCALAFCGMLALPIICFWERLLSWPITVTELFILTGLLVAGGVVSIATNDSRTNGGNTAMIVVYSIASLIVLANFNLMLAVWCISNVIIAIGAIIDNKNKTLV